MVIPATQPFSPSLASSEFGQRPRGDFHLGRDYATRKGMPVRATQAGRVSAVGGSRKHIWGHYLHVDSGDRDEQQYHVLRDYPTLKVGDRVKLGQVIGFTGDTDTYFPHHHYADKRGSFFHNPALLPYSEEAFAGNASKPFDNRTPVVPPQIGTDMLVYANKDTNVWAAGIPGGGFWQIIPAGQGETFIKASGHDRVDLSEPEFATTRNLCLSGRDTDTKVYADTGNDVWWLLGPGVVYQIPPGKGPVYESSFGPRIAVSSAVINDLQEAFRQGNPTFDFNGVRAAVEAAAPSIADAVRMNIKDAL